MTCSLGCFQVLSFMHPKVIGGVGNELDICPAWANWIWKYGVHFSKQRDAYHPNSFAAEMMLYNLNININPYYIMKLYEK
jgi:hypothetical protein